MNWIVIGGAAVGASVLGGGLWALWRPRETRISTPEEAAEAADRSLPGFSTEGAVLGADGVAALAVDARGRVAVMKRAGKKMAVREVAWAALRSTAEGIVIETGDRGFGSVALAGVDVLDIRRLAPRHAKPLAS